MVLESTIVCIDNSEFMRNGDFEPTRLQAQLDAVDLVFHSKLGANAENNVALLTLSSPIEVPATLNSERGRFMSELHQVKIKGYSDFLTGIKIAHLVLRNRPGKSHKMRIVAFIGSPLDKVDEQDLVELAKRLRKEKVNVDIINFGEEETNTEKLSTFVSTINGRGGTSSHLFSISSGTNLHDALVSSALIQGEDGTGLGGANRFEFGGVDANDDPELALALRISIEEQRMRLEEQARKEEGANPPENPE
ncbi:26S proteasome non-ATPase regulatory subunit 4, partial [Fragariocoptes setiger]